MDPILLIFQIAVLFLSVIVHEVSHGLMALHLGDETAKNAGRLTLNPLKHIDPIGSILVPILTYMSGGFLFGWALPVPYNPRALYKDYVYGPLKVALAGPLSNFGLALIFGTIIRFGGGYFNPLTIQLLYSIVLLNCVLFIFNLIPIPPLDGSQILKLILPRESFFQIERLGMMGLVILIIFMSVLSNFVFGIAVWLARFLVGA